MNACELKIKRVAFISLLAVLCSRLLFYFVHTRPPLRFGFECEREAYRDTEPRGSRHPFETCEARPAPGPALQRSFLYTNRITVVYYGTWYIHVCNRWFLLRTTAGMYGVVYFLPAAARQRWK